ncbi:hypothetical protein [Gemmata sp.]|uniref:hypothetical protein n=1 Tax=Gemmata sp. TaxID=1914242 RepID=UPI003F70383E
MDVFRFVKLTQKANDPARRYTLVSVAGGRVAELEVIPPQKGTVVMSLSCSPVLSDAAREDALSTTRRFLEELALGWGVHLVETPAPVEMREQPDGRFAVRLEFEAV